MKKLIWLSMLLCSVSFAQTKVKQNNDSFSYSPYAATDVAIQDKVKTFNGKSYFILLDEYAVMKNGEEVLNYQKQELIEDNKSFNLEIPQKTEVTILFSLLINSIPTVEDKVNINATSALVATQLLENKENKDKKTKSNIHPLFSTTQNRIVNLDKSIIVAKWDLETKKAAFSEQTGWVVKMRIVKNN